MSTVTPRGVLGLDLGTRTGWALYDGTMIDSGVQVFDVRRGESPGMRYLRFRTWLAEVALIDSWGNSRVRLIGYEQPHHRGGAATEVLAGFSTSVQAFCARYNIEHAAIHTGTLKKVFTGSSATKKAGMIAEANRRAIVKHLITDDNEADAVAVLCWAMKQ